MTATHPSDNARRLLAQRLTQATTPDELQAIGRELLDRYVTFRYAAEALLEAVLDGRPSAGRKPTGRKPTWLTTSEAQWEAVRDHAARQHMAASDVVLQAANRALAHPPTREQAADLTARYGRGTDYVRGKGHTWRPDPALRDELAELAADIGVSVSVLLRWGLDRKVT